MLSGPWARAQGYNMSPLRGWRIAGQHQLLKWSRKLRCSFNLPYRRCSISIWCLVVGRTEDAIRAGTAQTPPLCRRDYAVNEVSKCVRSSGNCSICSVRPTPRADLQNASARDSRCPSLTRRVTKMMWPLHSYSAAAGLLDCDENRTADHRENQ